MFHTCTPQATIEKEIKDLNKWKLDHAHGKPKTLT